MIQIGYKRGKGSSTDDPRHHPSLDYPGKDRYFYAFLCQVQFLSVSRLHRPGLPMKAHPFLQELSVYSKEWKLNRNSKQTLDSSPLVAIHQEAEQWKNLLDPMFSRAIPFPFPPIEAQPSEALPPKVSHLSYLREFMLRSFFQRGFFWASSPLLTAYECALVGNRLNLQFLVRWFENKLTLFASSC